MKTTIEIPYAIAITMQASLLSAIRQHLRFRNAIAVGESFRRSVREDIAALRFIRQNILGV